MKTATIALSFVAVSCSLLLASCATTDKPTRPMIYASAALKGAERSQAEKRAPDLYRRAENAYMKANQYYIAKEFELAQKFAVESRRLAEQAELESELKEAQSDGGGAGG